MGERLRGDRLRSGDMLMLRRSELLSLGVASVGEAHLLAAIFGAEEIMNRATGQRWRVAGRLGDRLVELPPAGAEPGPWPEQVSATQP